MNTENLSTLKIHKLTQEQYDREFAAGNIDENALYLTPEVEIDLSGYATEEYVNTQIAAIPTPDVSGQIGTHNTSTSAHNDIRDLIIGLTTRLNALADSDDTTLDQMSEIVAYIKSNKSLIEQITTNKINVADIIDNLTTNVSNKPLSAAQGVALKALIDAIDIPTKVSELTNDSKYITASGAPVQSVNGKTGVVQLTASDVGALPNTTQIPTVPTKVSELSNDSGFITASDIPEDKPGIIDVLELPAENIDENCFYRKLSGNLVVNQGIVNEYTVYCVETLPDTGEPATNADMTQGNIYYDLSTNECYAYVDSVLSAVLSIPAGWCPGATFLEAMDRTYGGIITNILDDPMDNKVRILLEYVMYSYKDSWTCHKYIGWSGTGRSAEIFNHPSNIASGWYSHAEGGRTVASGDYSHAEGVNTIASGSNSHAEGHHSHAEGFTSHAEGNYTAVSGYYSHAEGYYTTASSDYQHVQGKLNIEDTENKYAHIVGNGTSKTKRSNAHTVDWNGNAWYRGDVYVGGTSQDDGATKLAKLSDIKVQSVNGKTGAVQLSASDVGALTTDDLSTAVNEALAQAKASGEFNGDVGLNWRGEWSRNEDYAKNDAVYRLGSTYVFMGDVEGDGSDMTMAPPESSHLWSLLASKGGDGTSVTISNISESNASGGINTVTFSDGEKLNVKNGKDGVHGASGFGIYVTDSLPKMNPDGYLECYTDSISNNGRSLQLGDLIFCTIDNNIYKISNQVDSTLVYVDLIGNIKGETPIKGTDYFTEADKTEMVEAVNDTVREEILTDEGIIRQDVLPEGFPYVSKGVVVPESIITVDRTLFDAPCGPIMDQFTLVAGNSYTVNYNNVEYQCTAKTIIVQNVELVTIGNSAPIDGSEPTNDPFLIVDVPESMTAGYGCQGIVAILDGSSQITLSITGNTVQKISKELLPNIGISNIIDGIGIASARGVTANPELGDSSFAFGSNVKASGNFSHAEGSNTVASGDFSHAEGNYTTASGQTSHAEGDHTTASEYASHAEGDYTIASGNYSHAEGSNTVAFGSQSHAEGLNSHAEGDHSHAEGYNSHAEGQNSHAEGYYSHAEGIHSHAEGRYSHAEGMNSHVEGYYSHALGEYQHVQGKYNIADNTSAFIIGNGDSNIRSNAHIVDWDGNAWFAGDAYVGSTSGTNKDEGSKKLATEEYINEMLNIDYENTLAFDTLDIVINNYKRAILGQSMLGQMILQ